MSDGLHLICQNNNLFFFSERPDDDDHNRWRHSDGGGPSTSIAGVGDTQLLTSTSDSTRKKRLGKISCKRIKGKSCRVKNKRLGNSGEQYNNVKGKTVKKKVFENIPCNCKMK